MFKWTPTKAWYEALGDAEDDFFPGFAGRMTIDPPPMEGDQLEGRCQNCRTDNRLTLVKRDVEHPETHAIRLNMLVYLCPDCIKNTSENNRLIHS